MLCVICRAGYHRRFSPADGTYHSAHAKAPAPNSYNIAGAAQPKPHSGKSTSSFSSGVAGRDTYMRVSPDKRPEPGTYTPSGAGVDRNAGYSKTGAVMQSKTKRFKSAKLRNPSPASYAPLMTMTKTRSPYAPQHTTSNQL